MAGRDLSVEERLSFLRGPRAQALDGGAAGKDRPQAFQARGQWFVEEIDAVNVENVEEGCGQWCGDAQYVGIMPGGGPGTGDLEGVRPPRRIQGNSFAIEDRRVRPDGPHELDDLGQSVGDLLQRSGE